MIVVADTTPLNYLILIDLIHIVHDLFGQVVISAQVGIQGSVGRKFCF